VAKGVNESEESEDSLACARSIFLESRILSMNLRLMEPSEATSRRRAGVGGARRFSSEMVRFDSVLRQGKAGSTALFGAFSTSERGCLLHTETGFLGVPQEGAGALPMFSRYIDQQSFSRIVKGVEAEC
jgi:hypothetical protein